MKGLIEGASEYLLRGRAGGNGGQERPSEGRETRVHGRKRCKGVDSKNIPFHGLLIYGLFFFFLG